MGKGKNKKYKSTLKLFKALFPENYTDENGVREDESERERRLVEYMFTEIDNTNRYEKYQKQYEKSYKRKDKKINKDVTPLFYYMHLIENDKTIDKSKYVDIFNRYKKGYANIDDEDEMSLLKRLEMELQARLNPDKDVYGDEHLTVRKSYRQNKSKYRIEDILGLTGDDDED